MKIKNRKKAIVLCAAFVAAGVGMNVQNAIAYYGMASPKGSLLAQSITGYTDSNFFSNASSIGSSIASSIVSNVSSYWVEKNHACVEEPCSFSALLWTLYGKWEKCADGNKVSHCWSCKMCDA